MSSRQYSGPRIALSVAGLLALTAIGPPAGAYALARWRLASAMSSAQAGAEMLAARKAELADLAGDAVVLSGPGRLPRANEAGQDWVQNPVSVATAFEHEWPRDPWGRCYLLHVAPILRGEPALLLSAGPNGDVETPLTALTPAGDDIGAPVR